MQEDKLPYEMKEQFTRLWNEEYSRHYRVKAMIEELEGQMGRAVREVRKNAIWVIEKSTWSNWLDSTTIDIFKYLDKDMKRRGRPYVQCMRLNYKRVIVWVPNTTYVTGLISSLLLVAEPQVGEPTFLKKKFPSEHGKLQVWRTKSHNVFSFNNHEGEHLFKEWVKMITTDPAMRTRLGIGHRDDTV